MNLCSNISIQSRPTVSVIIPTYNRAGVLGRSIESVLVQTYRDFELIIVDDGSTDYTKEVVGSYSDPRIRFIRQEKNRGFAVALNIGIKAARGEYIALLDSDDEWLPAKLEKQMALFSQDKTGDLGLVLCEVLTSSRRGESIIAPRINLLSYEMLLLHRRDNGYCTPQLLIRRSLAGTELYLDENLSFSGEWDLLVRLAPLCRFDYVPEPLARIHISNDSMSLDNINRLETSLKILGKYRAEFREHPAALGSNYFDIALNYHLAGQEMHQVRHYLLAAIRAYPWYHVQYFALAFSVLGHTGMRWFLKLKVFLTNPIETIKIIINRHSSQLTPESGKSKTGDTLKYPSPKRQWSIRQYQDGDETQIRELRAIALNNAKNSQWWKWQYLEHPDGLAIIYLAEAHQKIVGHRAIVPVRIKIGDEIHRGSCGIDAMTHPDYQRQGIYVAIGNLMYESACKKGIDIVYGTPNRQSFSISTRRLQWFEISNPPVMVKIIDWGIILKKRFRIPCFIGKRLGKAFEFVFKKTRHFKSLDTEIQQITTFDERMDKFWLKASLIKPIMVVRDRKYLNWRYVYKPDNNYKIYIASRMDEIVGYIVVSLDKEVDLVGIIVDLLALPGEEPASGLLIEEALKYFERERTMFVKCLMLRQAPYFKILKKMGFMVFKSAIRICARINNRNISKEQISDPRNWYYTYGGCDST
jgi:glycosyltransferase involved in cell wall biosynthesis/GNAT superfamily N-acetyltransferase